MPLTDYLHSRLLDVASCLDAYVNANPHVAEQIPVLIKHGSSVVVDECCPGEAWVRVTSVSASNAFPIIVTGVIDCPPPLYIASLELGVVRCACVPDDNGNPPSADCYNLEALTAGADRSALLQTITCCFPDVFGRKKFTFEGWQPMATQGGCMGQTVTASIPFPACCDDLEVV